MDITVVINNQCASNSHLHLTVTVAGVNRTRTFPMMLARHDWVIDDIEEMEEIVKTLIRNWHKTTNPPAAQFKSRLESQVFKY